MKTLSNHVILYDDECPMCDLYTNAFISTGMLDKDGREAYSSMPDALKNSVNMKRACDEIALVDLQTGNAVYGIDSLFKVLSTRVPVLKPLVQNRYFHSMMKTVYAFISYNRKVIVPGKQFERTGSCTPAFNPAYRWAYIVFTWLVTSLVLTSYSKLLFPVIPETNMLREFLICGGQIAFQAVAIFFIRKDRIMHYLGNMMTISFAGALLLVPALCMAKLQWIDSPFVYLIWFGGVVSLMFLEHLRRVALLEIHWTASLTWVLYRLIVLSVIL